MGEAAVVSVGGSLAGVAVFFAATLLVDFYDIARPRGDSIAISGPLVTLAILEYGLWGAVAVGLGSSLVVHGFRWVRHRDTTIVGELLVRATSIALAALSASGLSRVGLDVLGIAVVPTVYLMTEMFLRQVLVSRHRNRSLRRLMAGNLTRQGLLFAAELSVSALAVLTYSSMGAWSAVPVVALLLLMRQAYSMLLEIRETYLNTVSVLVEAAESQTPGLSGHGERTAAIARAIGEECGLSTADIERISYAAMLHDIGRISDTDDVDPSAVDSASLLEGVPFFEHVVPILHVTDGELRESPREMDLLAGFIVALASDIDSASHLDARGFEGGSRVVRVAPIVPSRMKALVVAAAVGLGHSVPAIS